MGDNLPEEFYTLVGRVVVRATELERTLLRLYAQRIGPPPPGPESAESEHEEHRRFLQKWGKESGTTLVKEMKKVDVPDHYRTEFHSHLDAVIEALNDRHGLAHSTFIAVGNLLLGDRYVRSQDREPLIQKTEESLQQQLEHLDLLINWTVVWKERLPPAR